MLIETTQKRITITRYKRKNKYFTENLENGIGLNMVLIPGGTFLMGFPEDELDNQDNERPQHEVTLQAFFMGQYTVTQAQWRVVASYPQIERKLNPNPSQFKGDNRPVEKVSWNDAIEFCQRLSAHTRREYRLPTEAQWEYACRAGTTTPFHFGETITPELANYDGTFIYRESPKGENRKQTIDVGSFPANNFGLYDMHGNVWEWCEDDYHDSSESRLDDANALIDQDHTEIKAGLRGGSWFDGPTACRSAFQVHNNPHDFASFGIGFRVVCVIPKGFAFNHH